MRGRGRGILLVAEAQHHLGSLQDRVSMGRGALRDEGAAGLHQERADRCTELQFATTTLKEMPMQLPDATAGGKQRKTDFDKYGLNKNTGRRL